MSSHDESRIMRPEFRWAIIFAAWTLFGLAQILLASTLSDAWSSRYIGRSTLHFMPRVWGWALLTPVIAMWDSFARRRSESTLVRALYHVPLYIAAAVVETVIRRTTITMVGPPPMLPFYVTLLYFADIEAVRYLAALMLGRVLEASRELVKRERRAVALKEEIARAQLHYLDMQLQPHFLFNALGSISELAHEAPAAAARMVDHLSSLLRYATQRRTSQEVTLREELAALDPYLQIQRMRFPDWLSISERIEPGAEDALVPRMLLQPLVENAIRHGLSHRTSGGRIVFTASVHDDDLILSVHDNGAGLNGGQAMPGLGIGLANIRERLSTLYADSQSLELVSHQEGGVEVRLRLPYRRSSVATQRDDVYAGDSTESETQVDEPGTVVHSAPPRASTGFLRLTAGWIVAGVLLTLLSIGYVTIRRPGAHEPLAELLRRHAILAGLWIVLTPIVVLLTRRFPISRARLFLTVPLHLAASILVAGTHVVAFFTLVGDGHASGDLVMNLLFWDIAVYGVLVGIAQRTGIEEWIREKDLAVVRMRAELTTARLSTVMIELRPDFLLSSLASLRTLVAFDAAKAEKLLTSLADFLRLTMESLTQQKVTVEREIALLKSYARVYHSGAGHFPEIETDIPSVLEKALVPTGVTRTLAERLVEAGNISDRLRVSVRRNDMVLTVTMTPCGVSNRSEFDAEWKMRDPFRRIARLTDSGAVVRFSCETSSLQVDLPFTRGQENVAQNPGSLAVKYG